MTKPSKSGRAVSFMDSPAAATCCAGLTALQRCHTAQTAVNHELTVALCMQAALVGVVALAGLAGLYFKKRVRPFYITCYLLG